MKSFTKVSGCFIALALFAVAVAQTTPGTATGQPDATKLAQTLVNECAGIRQGELVLITGGTRNLDLLENVAVEVRKLGAHPLVSLESEQLARRSLTDVPAKWDTQEPTFGMKLSEIVDSTINIDYMEDPNLLGDIAPARLNDQAKAGQAVFDKLLARGVRQVGVGNGLYPTKARATQFGMSQDDLSRIFWNAVNVDYSMLQSTGEAVRGQLSKGSEMTITAPNGTNLTAKIAQRKTYVSDGVISAADRTQGGPACQVWLPAGEVYVSPVPGTANGTFVADTFFFQGKLIEGLKLEFKDGKLTSMTAKGDITAFKQRYDAAPAGKDVFGYFDIGINRSIPATTKSRMVTWMAAGTVSIGVGGNTWAGGENKVAYDFSAHLLGATLTVDGKPVVDKGALTTGT